MASNKSDDSHLQPPPAADKEHFEDIEHDAPRRGSTVKDATLDHVLAGDERALLTEEDVSLHPTRESPLRNISVADADDRFRTNEFAERRISMS